MSAVPLHRYASSPGSPFKRRTVALSLLLHIAVVIGITAWLRVSLRSPQETEEAAEVVFQPPPAATQRCRHRRRCLSRCSRYRHQHRHRSRNPRLHRLPQCPRRLMQLHLNCLHHRRYLWKLRRRHRRSPRRHLLWLKCPSGHRCLRRLNRIRSSARRRQRHGPNHRLPQARQPSLPLRHQCRPPCTGERGMAPGARGLACGA